VLAEGITHVREAQQQQELTLQVLVGADAIFTQEGTFTDEGAVAAAVAAGVDPDNVIPLEEDEEGVDEWVQCDKRGCKKWRVVAQGGKKFGRGDTFECKDLGGGVTCTTPEAQSADSEPAKKDASGPKPPAPAPPADYTKYNESLKNPAFGADPSHTWPDTGTTGKPRISSDRAWKPAAYSHEKDVIDPWAGGYKEALFITNDLGIRVFWEKAEANKETNKTLITIASLHIFFKACHGVYNKYKDVLYIDELCMKLFGLSFKQLFLVQQAECDLIKFLEFYYLLRDVLMMDVLEGMGARKEEGAAGVQERLRGEAGDVLRTSGGYPKYQQSIVSDVVRMLRMPKAFFKMWAERALVGKYRDTGEGASLDPNTAFDLLQNQGGCTWDENMETLNKHICETRPRTDEEMQTAVEMYNALFAADCAMRGGTHRNFFRRKYGRGHPAFAGKRLALFGRLRTLGGQGKLKVMLKDPADQVPLGNQADRPFAVGQACMGWRAEQRKYVCLKQEEPKKPAREGPISAQEILWTYTRKNGRRLELRGGGVRWEAPW
jgi:hypothetical protein